MLRGGGGQGETFPVQLSMCSRLLRQFNYFLHNNAVVNTNFFHPRPSRTTCLTLMCPDEEKGCSARELMKVASCRTENLLSNDIRYTYVMIGLILTELCLPIHNTVGTHRNRKMTNYISLANNVILGYINQRQVS